jgi:hypothetical protein
MTSYIAHHTKKKKRLARREAELRRLVDTAAPSLKLFGAANAVREARIRVWRAKRSAIIPKDDACDRYATIDRKIQSLVDTPISTILAEFGLLVDPVVGVDGPIRSR